MQARLVAPARLSFLESSARRRDALGFNPLDYIKQIVERVFDKHLPLMDHDNDTFSGTSVSIGLCALRG